MKPVSTALLDLFKTREFFAADLYEITLKSNGLVLRYCSGDQDVTYNGILFPATGIYGSGTIGGPYFDRSGNKSLINQSVGTSVDTMTIDIIPGHAKINGQPFLQACHDAYFDGATLKLHKAYMPSYGNTAAGAVLRFQGLVAQVDAGRSYATFTINSWLDLLNTPMPRNVYSPGCRFNLGDATCGVNLANYQGTGTITSASTAVIGANITSSVSGYYDQGKIMLTSGIQTGFVRTIKSVTFGSPGSITLLEGFPNAPAVGDTFNIWPGCDKTFSGANGCAKFQNQNNFGGEPRIPIPSTTL